MKEDLEALAEKIDEWYRSRIWVLKANPVRHDELCCMLADELADMKLILVPKKPRKTARKAPVKRVRPKPRRDRHAID